MGILTDYFVAPSDESAAETINRLGGPDTSDRSKSASTLCGFLSRRKQESALRVPAYPTAKVKNIDPVVQMGTLEEILTGRSFQEILDANEDSVLASRDGGERLVVKLTPEVTHALARLRSEEAADVAAKWALTEEFGGFASPQDLARTVLELQKLAQLAEVEGASLYCWLSV